MSKWHPYAAYFRKEWRLEKSAGSPLGIKTMLGQASKIGPKDQVRTFNRSLGATCCSGSVAASQVSSQVCRSRCYAWKISEGRSILERAEKNDRIWERADRIKLICGAIMDAGISWLRIHDIGDFKSPEDVDAWHKIAETCRCVHFWAYTRSWKFNRFIEPLKQFAALPNVDLLFSADRAMPDPPRIDGISVSWLADTDGDEPGNHVDVVFRGTNERSREEDERRKARKSSGALSLPVIGHHRNLTQVRSMKGAPVCPHQTGHEIKPAYQDCVSCCLCMPKARDRRASSIAVVRIETKQTADERIAQESAA